MGNAVKRDAFKNDDYNSELFKFKQNSKNGYLLVMGFITQNIEKDLKISIPMDIKEIIYKFWGDWINIKFNDIIHVKGFAEKWYKAIIRHHKRSNNKIPNSMKGALHHNSLRPTIELEGIFIATYASINLEWKQLKVGYMIDVKDKRGNWYLAKVLYNKEATESLSFQKQLKLTD